MKFRVQIISLCVCVLCLYSPAFAADLGGPGVGTGWTLGSDGVIVDTILDQDTLSGNDPNALATQQSIKAYVDTGLASYLPLAGGTMAGAVDFNQSGLQDIYQQVVTVAKAGGDYTTIQGAIDAITDATTSKRYAILIYPGDYTETIVMEDYVDLIGHGRTNTRILGTSGTVLTYPATKGTVSDLGVVATYGALGANSVAVTSSGSDSIMLRCSVTVSKSSGDYTMGSINVTGGAFRMIDSFHEYSITGTTTDTQLTQSAIRQSGALTTFLIYNSEITTSSDDTNDDVIGFETTTGGGGTYVIKDSIITVDASDGTSATGFWLYGTATGATLSKNRIVVTNPSSTYGLWVDSTAGGATVDSFHNEMVLDSAGAEVAYHADTGDTINVYFDAVVAASANSGGGTLNIVNAPSVGDLTATGTIEAGVLTEGGTGVYNITQSDAVYEGLLVNEAGLYSALSDVSQFYESGDTIPIADGGTGQTTAQAAIDALTAVSGATNEHVLTKDTGTGNAIWKAAASGFSDPMTTRGDLIYKNASGTTTRLAAGAADYVLTSDGTDIAWAAASAGSSRWTAETTFSRTDDDTISVTTADCTNYNPGTPIRFKATAGSYMYAVTTACTDVGSTINVDIDGVAFTTSVDDVLEWGDPSRLRVKTVVMPGNCAVDDPYSMVIYHQERAGYVVRATGRADTAPAGSALTFNLEVNNADAYSSEVSITAGSTAEFDSGVTVSTSNYDVQFGESLHISTSQCGSSTPGGNPLTFSISIIVP